MEKKFKGFGEAEGFPTDRMKIASLQEQVAKLEEIVANLQEQVAALQGQEVPLAA